MNLFALFLLTHLCCDFVWQSDQMAQCKRSTKIRVKWWPLLGHVLTQVPVALLLWGIGWYLQVPDWPSTGIFFSGLAVVLVTHWLFDLVKQNGQPILQKSFKLADNRVPLMSYSVDQGLHLAVLWLIGSILASNWRFNGFNRLLLASSIVLATLFFADYFISLFLKSLDLNLKRLPDGAKLGRHIGHLERFAILLLFFTDNVASIAVIVAIKALTRFKAIENNANHFAEYYLIGSLLSLIFGCLGGYLLSVIYTIS